MGYQRVTLGESLVKVFIMSISTAHELFYEQFSIRAMVAKQCFSSKLIRILSSIVHVVYTPYFGRSCSKSPIWTTLNFSSKETSVGLNDTYRWLSNSLHTEWIWVAKGLKWYLSNSLQTGHIGRLKCEKVTLLKQPWNPSDVGSRKCQNRTFLRHSLNRSRVYEMNILPTVFKLKLSGKTKVHKRSTFPQICTHSPNSIQSELFWLSNQTGHFSKSIYGVAKGTKMNCFPTAFKLKWVKWLEVYKRNTFPTFFILQQSVWIEHSSNSLQFEVIRTA